MKLIAFGDIVEENGRTIRENNMLIGHKIPIGTLVYVKIDTWHGNGASERIEARLFVVEHHRDCDGSPLYGLSKFNLDAWNYWTKNYENHFARLVSEYRHGFTEDDLTPIPLTDEVLRGDDALAWQDANEC